MDDSDETILSTYGEAIDLFSLEGLGQSLQTYRRCLVCGEFPYRASHREHGGEQMGSKHAR